MEKNTQVTLTYEQLQELLSAKASGSVSPEELLNMMKVFAEEIRKPDPETAERMALEKAKKKEAREVRIKEIQEEMAAREARQTACQHKTEKGRSVISGQVHADGLHHPICQRCGKEFTPRPPIGEMGMTASTTWNFGDPALSDTVGQV